MSTAERKGPVGWVDRLCASKNALHLSLPSCPSACFHPCFSIASSIHPLSLFVRLHPLHASTLQHGVSPHATTPAGPLYDCTSLTTLTRSRRPSEHPPSCPTPGWETLRSSMAPTRAPVVIPVCPSIPHTLPAIPLSCDHTTLPMGETQSLRRHNGKQALTHFQPSKT